MNTEDQAVVERSAEQRAGPYAPRRVAVLAGSDRDRWSTTAAATAQGPPRRRWPAWVLPAEGRRS